MRDFSRDVTFGGELVGANGEHDALDESNLRPSASFAVRFFRILFSDHFIP